MSCLFSKTVVAACVLVLVSVKPNAYGQPEAPRHPRGGVVYASMHLGKEITKRDVDTFCWILMMHNDQCSVFQLLLQKQQEAEKASLTQKNQHLWEQSARLGSIDAYSSLENAREYESFVHEVDRYVQSRLQAEFSLFQTTEAFLTEVQRARLPLIRNLRIRDRLRERVNAYPGCGIDMLRMLYELRAIDSVAPDHRERFMAQIAEYDSESTSLMKRYSDAWLEANSKEAVLLAEHPQIDFVNATPEQRTAYHEQSKPAFAKVLKLSEPLQEIGKRLHDLNARFVEAIAPSLPEEMAQIIVSEFRIRAYPAVYPNPFDLVEIIDDALEADASSEVHDAIAIICDDYRKGEARIAGQMVKRFLKYKEDWAKHRSNDRAEYGEYKTDMSNMQDERRQLASRTVKQLFDLLAVDGNEELIKHLTTRQEAIAAHSSSEMGFDFRP